MLSASYIVAGTAIFGATLYVYFRSRLFLTATTMLLGSLFVVYGVQYLVYMLTEGERSFLLSRSLGEIGAMQPVFPIIKTTVPVFSAVVISMNLSIALMYAGIVVGIECVERIFPDRIRTVNAALAGWNAQPLGDPIGGSRILVCLISALVLFMLSVSIAENHLGTIVHFFSITGHDDIARNAYRLHHGGSSNYVYRLMLGTIGPMLVVWGILAGWLNRSRILMLATALLFLCIVIGKLETLSKAPPAFFALQLIFAAALAFTNRLTLRTALGAAFVMLLILYLTAWLVLTSTPGREALEFVYFRVFDVPNQALIEYFAVFPALHPHMWGANMRPLAILMGQPYVPAYSIVAHTWLGGYDTTENALFIADAWADFSYIGVIVFSMIAGAICRCIDAAFLGYGKTVVAISVMATAFTGVFTLLATALSTALASGGLLVGPIFAAVLIVIIRRFNRLRPSAGVSVG
jgi:hypothetical protein